MTRGKQYFFAKAFPVPRSLALGNISVSISDGELCFFERKKGLYGRMPFPKIRSGALDENARRESILALSSFARKYRVREVRVVIPETEAYVFRVALPTVLESQLRSAIESVLEENVPISPAEAVFEHDIVSVDAVRGETTVGVSVVSQKATDWYAGLFTEAGLLPVSFETESRAISRAIFEKGSGDARLLLSIMSRHSVVSIIENATVVFSSSIEVGSAEIKDAIKKTLEVAPSSEDFDASLPVFSVFHDEIAKVLAYWKTQEKKMKEWKDISRITLSGSDSLMAGFSRYISLSFQIPVDVGSVWTNTLSPDETLPEITRRESLDYAAVIGALNA